MKMKLSDYKRFNYKVILEYHPQEKVYFARFPELPGCQAHGETAEKATKKANKVKDSWLEMAFEDGWDIPKPDLPHETSGRVTLRIPKTTHKRLVDKAEDEGVSLNQLILTYISEGVERASNLGVVKEIVEKQSRMMEDVVQLNRASGNAIDRAAHLQTNMSQKGQGRITYCRQSAHSGSGENLWIQPARITQGLERKS